ncbi:hypothetical protein J6590_026755 [Homalodisca vitripennis]|nr:hypothetical protein J6590_026755 [Homalodisca vitripennis]
MKEYSLKKEHVSTINKELHTTTARHTTVRPHSRLASHCSRRSLLPQQLRLEGKHTSGEGRGGNPLLKQSDIPSHSITAALYVFYDLISTLKANQL